MKKFRIFLLVMTGAAVLMLGGCKEKAKYDESAFQDDLEPLTDDELEAMDENSDDEMIVEDDAELDGLMGIFEELLSDADVALEK